MDAHVERAQQRSSANCAQGDRRRTQIEPQYQPLVQPRRRPRHRLRGAARWDNAVLGAIPAQLFIVIAEESGLIHRLGDQLLRSMPGSQRNGRQISRWRSISRRCNCAMRRSACARSLSLAKPVCRRRGSNWKSRERADRRRPGGAGSMIDELRAPACALRSTTSVPDMPPCRSCCRFRFDKVRSTAAS